jgi:hypothetical protein
LFNKGISLENMEHARGFFERALAVDPGNIDAVLGVGRADFMVAQPFCRTTGTPGSRRPRRR